MAPRPGNDLLDQLTRYREGGAMLRGVEVFEAGQQKDEFYSDADLDDMVRNFNLHSRGQSPKVAVPVAIPRLMPGAPAVLGHEEEQDILQRSDLPAAGWPVRLYRGSGAKAHKLLADIGGVAPIVAKCIKHRRYRTTSAEVYNRPPQGVPGSGKMLRRISFLGADVPQIKSLEHLPMPEEHAESFAVYDAAVFKFSDRSATPNVPGCFTSFFEGRSMGHDELIAALQQLGADTSLLDGVPDEALAEMVRVCQGQAGSVPDPDPDPDAPAPAPAAATHSAWDDSDTMPDPANDDEAQQYADRARAMAQEISQRAPIAQKWMEKYCAIDNTTGPAKPMAEPVPAAPNPGQPAATPAAAGPVTRHPTKVVMQYTESQLAQLVSTQVSAALKTALAGDVASSLAELTRFRDETRADALVARVDAFLKANGVEGTGKILPFEVDRGNPANLRDQLLRADRTKVIKFTEDGKEYALTDLELQMKAIERRRADYFSEGAKSSEGGAAGTAGTEAETVIKQHFAAFREDYKVKGIRSADQLIADYKTYPAVYQAEFIADYKKQLKAAS